MTSDKAGAAPESVSRMLGWGRSLMVGGAVLVLLAFGTRFAGSPEVAAGLSGPLLWCGAIATISGVILTALGAVEQRLIETRTLMLTAIEHLKADTPVQTGFRSRPAPPPQLRTSHRLR